jgi:hypothetical protein
MSNGRGGVVKMAFIAAMLPAASDNGRTNPHQLTPHRSTKSAAGPQEDASNTESGQVDDRGLLPQLVKDFGTRRRLGVPDFAHEGGRVLAVDKPQARRCGRDTVVKPLMI